MGYMEDTNDKPYGKEKESVGGWLKNPDRKARRDAALTLTDSQVQELIQKVDTMPEYSHYGYEPALGFDVGLFIRHRDEGLIALTWIFFKRGNEILHVKFGDVTITTKELLVSLYIEKKQKRYKLCPICRDKKGKPTKNSIKSQFCKSCGLNIKELTPTLVGAKPEKKVKRKSINNPFCKYVVQWYKDMKSIGAQIDWWMFPRVHYFSEQRFLFTGKKPLTIQRFDQILQRLDHTLTSSMFRYGGAEKWLSLGYTPYDVKGIGDWSSSAMPERYADKKGITPKQREFSEDNREV